MQEYIDWNNNMVIADCLKDLRMEELIDRSNNMQTNRLLTIIESKAKKLNRHDVLERLYFAGLIYG